MCCIDYLIVDMITESHHETILSRNGIVSEIVFLLISSLLIALMDIGKWMGTKLLRETDIIYNIKI